jgi:hypothetical protein
MQNYHSLLEQVENGINWQQPSQVFNDPIDYYIDGLCSQSFHPLTSCKPENEEDDELVSEPDISFLLTGFSLQQYYAYFQSLCEIHQLDLHGSRNVVGGMIQDDGFV